MKTIEEKRKANRKAVRKYRKTEKGKIVFKKACKKYRQSEKGKRYHLRFPKRYTAKNAVNSAVRHGKIPCIKTRRCYFCYKQAHQYHHYKGYEPEFKLDIIPICFKCHKKIHKHKGVA